MRYFKYNDEYGPIQHATTYIETVDGYVLRQVTFNKTLYIASNIESPPWGLCLAEGQFDYDEIEEVTEMSREEFEAVWNAYLLNHSAAWEVSKASYPVGTPIEGHILVFYPQGTIIRLSDGTLGVADYTACKESTSPSNLYPRHIVAAIVQDYDEINHWLILDQPQIYAERVKLIHDGT